MNTNVATLSALPLDARLAIAAAGIAAVILYGSLFPFHFEVRAIPSGPLSALLSTWNIPDDRGDAVSNFFLYLPFGFFFVRALRTLPRWALTLLVTMAGFALSMCIEMVQLYIPGRDSALGERVHEYRGRVRRRAGRRLPQARSGSRRACDYTPPGNCLAPVRDSADRVLAGQSLLPFLAH